MNSLSPTLTTDALLRRFSRLKSASVAFTLLLVLLGNLTASAQIPQKSLRKKPLTVKEAQQWCDSHTIKQPEGIYWFPSCRAIVLVRNSDNTNIGIGPYEIVCIESENLMYPPGQVLGYLATTGDATQLNLTLYGKVSVSGLTKPRNYLAKYNASRASITYQKPKIKITFNPLSLIPKLGRLVKISNQNPNSNPTEGLQRIYPKVLTSPGNSFQLPMYF